MLILRELLSDGRFESDFRTLLRKSDFFGDDEVLYDGNYKWLRQLEILSPQHGADVSFVISATHVCMSADGLGVDQVFLRISLGKIGVNAAFLAGHGREVIRLQPKLVRSEYPT